MPHARVESTGIELDFDTYGSRDDPAVLLLMGLSGSSILWPHEFIDGLVARGYHVITYDHRDVGRSTIVESSTTDLDTLRHAFSGWAFTPAYTLADLARDAIGLLDHLDITRAHLVGISMGGMVAQHLAFDHPLRVTSLTTINSTSAMRGPDQPLPRLADVPDPRPPTDWEEFSGWFVDGLRELSSPRWFDAAETRALAAAVWDRGVNPAGNLRHLLAILADGDRAERLRRVAAPTLVIHGADDPLVPVDGARATAAAVSGARLVVLEDMAHDLPLPLVPRILSEITTHLDAAGSVEEARTQ